MIVTASLDWSAAHTPVKKEYVGFLVPCKDDAIGRAVARTLTTVQNCFAAVWVVNPSTQPVHLPTGHNLGQLHSITGRQQEEFEFVDTTISAPQRTKPLVNIDRTNLTAPKNLNLRAS